MDIDIKPSIEEGYNWWWTWPALYPLPIYWPLQIRRVQYEISIFYSIFDVNNKEIINNKFIKKEESEVEVYGFFNIGIFEQMIERVNLEVMEECAVTLKKIVEK